jgi:HD superfamily phosphodiesterase
MQFEQAIAYIKNRLDKELPAHLYYHSPDHVMDVYLAAETIGKAEGLSEGDMRLLLTAAMYHDSGFLIQTKDHEMIGCGLVREVLPGFDYSAEEIEAVCSMIMATKVPQSPKNAMEEILCDADLDYLGRADFYTIGEHLFHELREMGIVADEREWNTLQVRFLEQHQYFTATSIAARKAVKDGHLHELRAGLLGK